MSEWNPQRYLAFEKERTQPAIDLAARLSLSPARVLDIGCGPGNSTQVLARRFPLAQVTGVDSSAAMIRAAKKACPGLNFVQCDAGGPLDALGKGYDLVFSNACIQWVPDHPRLLPRLMSLLAPGGILAVQVPVNEKEPIQQIVERTAALPQWQERAPCGQRFHTLAREAYFDLLAEIAEDFTMWETVYMHRLPSHQAIMDWYSSTGLRPYLEAAVDGAAREGFYQDVFRQVREAYPARKNGEIIFRFPRLFFLAKKPG